MSSSRNPGTSRVSFGPVAGVAETVDPELAQLRYRLWRRVMTPETPDQSVPLLLGRASRAIVPDVERLAGVDCPPEGAAHLTGLPEWERLVEGGGRGRPAGLAGEVCGSPGGPAHRGGR